MDIELSFKIKQFLLQLLHFLLLLLNNRFKQFTLHLIVCHNIEQSHLQQVIEKEYYLLYNPFCILLIKELRFAGGITFTFLKIFFWKYITEQKDSRGIIYNLIEQFWESLNYYKTNCLNCAIVPLKFTYHFSAFIYRSSNIYLLRLVVH